MNTHFTSFALAPAGDALASVGTTVRRSAGRAASALWRSLELIGQARAHSHLLGMADRCEALQPELANKLRAAARQGPMA